MPRSIDVPALIEGVKSGDRAALARSSTLVESRKPAHRALARELLRELAPLSGNSIRLGLSGVPGAGKSTFTDALGVMLIEKGHRVAVLAVDPSSSVSGGSVLGDRTRMGALAELEDAFFPQPSDIIDAVHEHILPLKGYTPVRDCSTSDLMRRSAAGV